MVAVSCSPAFIGLVHSLRRPRILRLGLLSTPDVCVCVCVCVCMCVCVCVCVCSQIGQETVVQLKSTCGCNFTLHYEVASRGNIVQSGLQHPNQSTHRQRRAAVIFDKNIHTTQTPSETGQPPCRPPER